MFLISKDEAQVIRNKFRDVAIYVTMRQGPGKRKRYYTEERPEVIATIKHLREQNVVEHYE